MMRKMLATRRVLALLAALTGFTVLTGLAVPVVWAAERMALVIGNSAYRNAPRLSNPVNDAAAIAEALKRIGFTVTGPLMDLDKVKMDAALLDFGRQAQAAEAVVVFFAGHGLEAFGQNYLIPVDAMLEREATASVEAVALNTVLGQIAGPRGYRLVILDACRDNPLANRMQRQDGKRAVYRGLGRVEPSHQIYVAYAAKDGTRARDDGGGGHSPFTAALLKYMEKPLQLPNLFGAVREDVLEATGNEQEPWLYGAFGRKIPSLAQWNDQNPQPGSQPIRPAPTPTAPLSAPVPLQPGQVFRDRLRDGSEGPALVVIGAGEFWMGSPEGEEGRDSDERRHRVRIERAFALGQNEVTVREFRRFVEATGYRTEAERDVSEKGCYTYDAKDNRWDWRAGFSWRKPGYEQTDDHPVVCVSWNDANQYLGWLTKETGRNYRLPSEAEWEYAARAGTTEARYWRDGGDASACGYANVANKEHGWSEAFPCSDGYEFTAPVGSFQPNAWKLYDMLGNVWEWTCSAYAKEYDGSESRCADQETSGPLAVRGGSWLNGPAWVRSANRDWGDPTYRDGLQGFRLARSL